METSNDNQKVADNLYVVAKIDEFNNKNYILKLLSVEAKIYSDEKDWLDNPTLNYAKNEFCKLKCGLYTGATNSIISIDAAKKYAIKIVPSQNMFKTVDGIVRNVLGRTKWLSVDIQGVIAELSFVVIDHDDHEKSSRKSTRTTKATMTKLWLT